MLKTVIVKEIIGILILHLDPGDDVDLEKY